MFFDQAGAGDPKAHPEFAFYQNEAWMKMQEMQAAAQQAQQQAAQPQPGQPPPGGGGGQPAPPGQESVPGQESGGGDLTAGVDQLASLLGKSEGGTVHQSRAKLRAHQKAVNMAIMDSFRSELPNLTAGLADLADQHKPKGKG
jgi:hypothetical protein